MWRPARRRIRTNPGGIYIQEVASFYIFFYFSEADDVFRLWKRQKKKALKGTCDESPDEIFKKKVLCCCVYLYFSFLDRQQTRLCSCLVYAPRRGVFLSRTWFNFRSGWRVPEGLLNKLTEWKNRGSCGQHHQRKPFPFFYYATTTIYCTLYREQPTAARTISPVYTHRR